MLGSKLVLTGALLDSQEAKVVRRASAEVFNDPDRYSQGVRDLVTKSFGEAIVEPPVTPETAAVDSATLDVVLACLARDAEACAKLRERSVKPIEAAVEACGRGEEAACEILPEFEMPEVVEGLSAACSQGSEAACATLLRHEDSDAVEGLYVACVGGVHGACEGLVESGRVDELGFPALKWTGVAVMIAGGIMTGVAVGFLIEGAVTGLNPSSQNPRIVASGIGGGVLLAGLVTFLLSLPGDFLIDEVHELRDKPFLSASVAPIPSAGQSPAWTVSLTVALQ